jgi:hypothetical protein
MDISSGGTTMQTNDMNDRNSSTRTLLLGFAAGAALAAAMVGAFMLAGRAGGEAESLVEAASPTSAPVTLQESAAKQAGPASASNPVPNGDAATAADEPAGAEPESPAPTATPEPAAEDDEPTITPTVTPGSGCKFCPEKPELVAPSPTPHPGCIACAIDGGFAQPVDTEAPVIFDVQAVICGADLIIDFKVDSPAEVWVTYELFGDTVTLPAEDVAYQAHFERDVDWDILTVNHFYVHAVDMSLNTTESGPHSMPDIDFTC